LDAEGGRALLRAVEQCHTDVCIDGSALQRIDGAGLTALAVARQHCRAEGHTFAVTEVARGALRDLRVGGRLLELFATPSAPDIDPLRHLRRRHDGTR
jgi:anti-anti-sigma regulatory factor